MQIDQTRAHGHTNASTATVTAVIEDWGNSNLRHHIKQQGIQIARDEIDVPHDVSKVHVAQGGWDIDAVILTQDEEEMAGAFFVADSWNWQDGDRSVSYYYDNETDPQAEIRQRCEDALTPIIADESPFKQDMLTLGSVTIDDQFRDKVSFEV